MLQVGMPRTHSIAIVGLGPKGLHCLERLLAQVSASPLQCPLHIRLFNSSATFGASPIYDPEQPDYILVNISVGEIDLWTANDPPPTSGRGPDFVTWHHQQFPGRAPLSGQEYLPRAVVGQYLSDGFRRICGHLPASVTLTCIQGEVVDIAPLETGYRIQFVAPGGDTGHTSADKILLATGHSQVQPREEERSYQEFAHRHAQAIFIPYVYPVRDTMRLIPPGSRVVMKGIGLTFIDAVLELTEGRGGRFHRTPQSALTYEASGQEPRSIYPFSRSGLPMVPKSYDLPPFDRPLTFLDDTALATLLQRSRNQKLSFETDLLPLVEAEMALNFYRVVMDRDWRERLHACGSHPEAMMAVIDSFHHAFPEVERFSFRFVLNPARDHHFDSGSNFDAFVEQYMEAEIARSRLGQAGSGIKSALEIWYECRKALGQFLQFGGITPASHKSLLEEWFPLFKRVAFGPPIINIEKLLALQKIGIIDFSVALNPQVLLDEASGLFSIRCGTVGDASIVAEVLVDARYPSVNIARDASALYQNLHDRGMIRLHKNLDSSLSSYSSGAIDMECGSQLIIDANGQRNEDIAVIGIPTEGNLIGNLTLARDEFSSVWASSVMAQLRKHETTKSCALGRKS